MAKQRKRSGGGSDQEKKAKKKGGGGFFERLAEVGNDVMNDIVTTAKEAGEVVESAGTSFLDAVRGEDEMSEQEIVDTASAVPNQDIIYEQLALAAYGKWSPESLAQWGYELMTEHEDPSTGLRIMAFAPVDYDFSEWPALEEVLKKQHGGMERRPVVSFRGTAESGGVMDDLNESGIGAYQFSASEGDIAGILAEASAHGKIDTTGHSLGGALAQICAARYPGLMGRVVTFQSPGINAEDAAKLEEHNAKAAPEDRIHSTHHRNSDDLVHFGGEALTEGVVYEWDKDGDSKLEAHSHTLLAELNDLRGGQVARTYGGGAYKGKADESGRHHLKKNAWTEKSTLEGVKVESTGRGKEGFMHGFAEKARHGVGTMVDNVGGLFSDMTDSRDDYVDAWTRAREMQAAGESLKTINDYIATADDLLPEQRLRLANQMSKFF